MCRNLSKYALIFLFLALSGLIFLLRNIHTVEVRREVGYTWVLIATDCLPFYLLTACYVSF